MISCEVICCVFAVIKYYNINIATGGMFSDKKNLLFYKQLSSHLLLDWEITLNNSLKCLLKISL